MPASKKNKWCINCKYGEYVPGNDMVACDMTEIGSPYRPKHSSCYCFELKEEENKKK